MNQSVFVTLNILFSLAVGLYIWYAWLPEYLRDGGPLVGVLIALSVMTTLFVIERIITLRKARGKQSVQSFFKKVVELMGTGDYEGAIAACDKQRGSLANIIRAGIERYNQVAGDPDISSDRRIEETQKAIEEANALEVPLLERNLIALSTIASIATMTGLLGTTIGMIRAFSATAGTGGVIDAESLAVGISEALVNTAGGLYNAIFGIIMYNVFVNKVDSFNYTIDEASYEVVQIVKAKEAGSK
ncbi:MAG: MotA/TolQ/ExbB proton channel family protein [candidate division Zixibacteria bacterium]|nr:MotA/TolQ/ExbB proton channel family protein [candidate division Zixibacteria bacterium]